MQGGVIVGTELGLVEIEQESQTQDGFAGGSYETLATLSASDGILLGSVPGLLGSMPWAFWMVVRDADLSLS